MRHARLLLTASLTALVLAAAGCGGDDDDNGGGGNEAEANASSLKCLTLSTLSPELYDASGEGVEGGVKPLLTGGAKGAEILTGKVAAVVIEYPSEQAATAALQEARGSDTLKKYVDPSKISVIEKTLFIDYSGEPHVKKVVEGCARNPDQPPPT